MEQQRTTRSLPLEVYASFVDALFKDARSLISGSIGAFVACVVAAVRTNVDAMFLCAGGIALLGLARGLLMYAYGRRPRIPATRRQLAQWELAYVVGATTHVALLGAFLFLAFALTSDAFVHLLTVAGLLAYIIGVAGRNFCNRLLVKSQILVAAAPMLAALPLKGPIYWVIDLFVLLPFFLSLWTQAMRQRQIYLDAVVRAHDLHVLATRFDAALNNMPHGLAMFDAHGTLMVSNRRFSELLHLNADRVKGTGADALLLESADMGLFDTDQASELIRNFRRHLRGEAEKELLVTTETKRTLSLKFQGMANKGSVVVVEDITERRNAEAQIQHLARYDALTGLPNRVQLREEAATRITSDRETAVIFIDLDHFKQVNDTLGHSRGDKLLREVADRLLTEIGDRDFAARFGGDEFIVLHAATDLEDVPRLAKGIIEALSRPYFLEGSDVVVGASIGIAVSPRDGTDIDKLLKNADIALYKVKLDTRGTWRFFEPAMDVEARERRTMETDLRQALVRGEFELFFQPLYNVRSRTTKVCEALLRWRHPQRGFVSPGEFVPIAEDMGLIVEIGDWVLHEACRQCMTWPDGVAVAVNVSSLQFRRGSVVTAVRHALDVSGLAPNRLEIEITESVLLQNLQLARIALQQIRELGVRISMDDFGTGYSSLSYLHLLPLHKVKIDRSFLDGLGVANRSSILLHGIARLSAELGMTVVVEGVETEEQFQFIEADDNIDEVQGYLFSYPLPSSDVVRLLSKSKAKVA